MTNTNERPDPLANLAPGYDPSTEPPRPVPAFAEEPVEQVDFFFKPYSELARFGYGTMWVIWTVVLTVVAVGGFAVGSPLAGLLAGGLAWLAGAYALRIWTWRAKRLIFFIVI
jgi:hypothetical protein